METKAVSMEESALHTLFVEQLQDIYWAEKHLVKNIRKMVEGATSNDLKTVFENHLEETVHQVERLEKVFSSLGEKAVAKKCEAMDGLVKEVAEMMESTAKGTMVRDVALIAAAQKIEHYEIASYGTLKTLAEIMNHTQARKLLEEILEEEKSADISLSGVAEGYVNESALQETVR